MNQRHITHHPPALICGFSGGEKKITFFFFGRQADRGFARSRLCTDEDGTTNNLVLYMVGMYIKKGVGRSAGYGIKEVLSNRSSSPHVAFVVSPRRVARRRRCTACHPAAPCRCVVAVVVPPIAFVVPPRRVARRPRFDASSCRSSPCCRLSPSSCHMSPCCPLPLLCRPLCCRPSPSSCRVVVPPVAVIVPPVALLTLAVVVSPVVVVSVVAAAFVIIVVIVAVVAIYHLPSP